MRIVLILLAAIAFPHEIALAERKYPPFIFRAKTIEGRDIDLSEHVGKRIIVVNFWATYCPPCVYEIPHLIRLKEDLKDEIMLVGVALDRYPETVKVFSQRYKFNYPLVHDSYGIAHLYGISVIPTTFVINYEGKIVERIIGARSYENFRSTVMKHVKSKVAR